MSENGNKGLAGALLAFQAEAPALTRDATNPHFRSKYTSLDSIVETIRPLLVKHGLVWTALPTRDETGEPALHYMLVHAATGDTIEGTMPLLVQKPDSQGFGSALTYARRYSLSAVLNLVAEEDDDGNAASRPSQARPKPSSAPSVATATPEDVKALKAAAKGLGAGKIKLAFGTVGLSVGEVDSRVFDGIPRSKAKELTAALAAVER